MRRGRSGLSVCLLDVNVLVALTWPTHVHHGEARYWFDQYSAAGWATCPITQLGFVRLSSNTKIIRDAVSPRDAVAMLERLTALPGHEFWSDQLPLSATGPFASLAFVGHRQVTDAYLLALAQRKDEKLATLDRGVAELIADHGQREQWIETINP